MKLYGYWRSSAAYRVRIALNLKGLHYEQESVHLLRNGGEQHSPAFAELNPAQLVPVLVDGDRILTQSLAILDYLEQRAPAPALLPAEPQQRAATMALALDIACDIHPLNNLRVLQYLDNRLALDVEAKTAWYRHWIETGFSALELKLEQHAGLYCVADKPSWADICLVPQVYNARRFNVDMAIYPRIAEIDARCRQLDAFARAAPENQPDAVA